MEVCGGLRWCAVGPAPRTLAQLALTNLLCFSVNSNLRHGDVFARLREPPGAAATLGVPTRASVVCSVQAATSCGCRGGAQGADMVSMRCTSADCAFQLLFPRQFRGCFHMRSFDINMG